MAWVLTDVTTGINLTAETDAQSVSIAHRAYAETSRLSARILDELSAISILTEHEVSLTDGGVLAFAGYVRSRDRTDRGVSTQRVYQIECQDYTTALGDDVCDTAAAVRANGESDKARITALFTAFGTRGIIVGASVVQLRAVMPDQDFTGLNLHQSLTLIASVTGGSFYVGFDKVLHYFASEALSAPFGLSDNPNGTTTFGYEAIHFVDDSAQYVNAVFVIGTGISGWRPSSAAVATLRAAGTLRAVTVTDPSVIDAATLNAAGDSVLATYSSVLQPASLVTHTPGLRAGMNVQITHAGWGIAAATYRIASIEATPVDRDRIAYSVFFGSQPISLATLQRQSQQAVSLAYVTALSASAEAAAVADLSVGGANLVPNSSFEDSTIWTVGASWAIDVAAADAFAGASEARYTPAGSSARLETPYITVARTDSYWASAYIFCRAFTSGRLRFLVEEYDAASTLLATTIVDESTAVDPTWSRGFRKFAPTGAIGTTAWQATTAKVKLVFWPNGVNATGTWSVDGVQLERGSLMTAYAPAPYELVEGSVGPTIIADDAVTTPKLVANAVTTGKLAAAAVTAVELAAGAVTADKISVGAVLPPAMLGDPKNLAPNASFETIASGQPAGWDPIGATFSVRTGGGGVFTHWGDKALQCTMPAGLAAQTLRSATFPILPNRRYIVSGWVSGRGGNNAAATATIAVNFRDFAGASVGGTPVIGTIAVGAVQSWRKITATIVTPAAAVNSRILATMAAGGAIGDVVYWDDFEFELADQDLDHAAGNVAITSSGIAVLNGAITVTNAAATVIIDGTSNMFKITATGTQSLAAAANTVGFISSVALTGLGALPTTPAHLSYLSNGNLVSSRQYLGYLEDTAFRSWDATSLNGTNAAASWGRGNWMAITYTTLDGSNQCVANMISFNYTAVSFYHRYYILKEAAL